MTESRPRRAVLTGGTGFTGGLVARELEERGIPFLLTGRDPGKLARTASRFRDPATALVDVTRPETLSRQLSAGDVVVNCAGPFTRLGGPVVRAAVESGAHYLDTTGEQRFMMEVAERWAVPARERGVTVCNAMAFEYAPGDAACALAAAQAEEGGGDRNVDLDVIYAWEGPASGTSPGTRASVLEVLGAGGMVLEDHVWREERVGARRRSVELSDGRRRPAVSFPSGEVVTAGRDPGVATVRGWMVGGRLLAAGLAGLGPALPPLARALRPVLEPLIRRAGPEEPSPEARRASEFTILVEARPAGGGALAPSRVSVRGSDPYGLTARLAAGAADELLDDDRTPPRGVVRPSAVLPPGRLLSIQPDLHCATEARAEG